MEASTSAIAGQAMIYTQDDELCPAAEYRQDVDHYGDLLNVKSYLGL